MTDTSTETDPEKAITFEKRDWIAIITIDVPAKLNALTQPCYFRIATLLHEIGAMDDITVTIVTGKGRFFSAGADVTLGRSSPTDPTEARKHWNQSFVANNLHNTHAWYTHPKILITALNGPAVGISAANTAHSDFIYAAPHAYLLTPFTSLGLVAEGGSSRAFVERMGVSKAKEALFLSKRLSAQELLQVGYVNAIIDAGAGAQGTGKGNDSAKFLDAVIAQVRDRFDPSHLSHYSILKMKALVQKPGLGAMDRAGLDEVWGGLDVFLKGAPQREFARMASGEKRHKL